MQCKNEDSPQYGWKYCRWTRLRDGARCLFKHMQRGNTDIWEIYQVCNGSLNLEFFGSPAFSTAKGNNICGVTFKSILNVDEGQWSCSLTYYDVLNHHACITNDMIFAQVGTTIKRKLINKKVGKLGRWSNVIWCEIPECYINILYLRSWSFPSSYSQYLL